MTRTQQIFTVVFLAAVLVALWAPFALAQETEVKYPSIGSAEPPRTARTMLPDYIKYIFYFAIGIAGFIAFGSLVYGGVRYLLSAGNPGAMSDGQSQMLAGFLGILLLLGSYILLNAINPQLVELTISRENTRQGIIICRSGITCTPDGIASLEEGTDYIRARSNLSCLVNCNNPTSAGFNVGSVYFYNSSTEVAVKLFRQKDYENLVWDSNDAGNFSSNTSLNVGQPSNSVEIKWKQPGVYLFGQADCKGDANYYSNSSADFGDFHDKARSIMIIPKFLPPRSSWSRGLLALIPGPGPGPGPIIPTSNVEEKLGAILHEKSNFAGDAEVFVVDDSPSKEIPVCENLSMNSGQGVCDNYFEPFCREHVRDRASALTVFRQVTQPINKGDPRRTKPGGGVTLYSNYDRNTQDPGDRGDDNKHCGPLNLQNWPDDHFQDGYPRPLWLDGSTNIGEPVLNAGGSESDESQLDCNYVLADTKGSSIEVSGDFIAVLFREDGRGEVFSRPGDDRLKGNEIGDDEARYLLVIPVAAD